MDVSFFGDTVQPATTVRSEGGHAVRRDWNTESSDHAQEENGIYICSSEIKVIWVPNMPSNKRESLCQPGVAGEQCFLLSSLVLDPLLVVVVFVP